jgi:hypothetical protein
MIIGAAFEAPAVKFMEVIVVAVLVSSDSDPEAELNTPGIGPLDHQVFPNTVSRGKAGNGVAA